LIPFLENAFKFVSNNGDNLNEIRFNLSRTDAQLTAIFYNTHDASPKAPWAASPEERETPAGAFISSRHTLHIGETQHLHVTLTLTL